MYPCDSNKDGVLKILPCESLKDFYLLFMSIFYNVVYSSQ